MNIKNRIFRVYIIIALIVSLVLGIFITSHAKDKLKFNIYNPITDEIGLDTDTLLSNNTLPTAGVVNIIYNMINHIDEEDYVSDSEVQVSSMSAPIEISSIEESIVEDFVEKSATEDIEIPDEVIENPQFIEVPEYYV